MTALYSKKNAVGGWSVYRGNYEDGIMLFANKRPVWLPKAAALRLIEDIVHAMIEYWSIDYHPDKLHLGLGGPLENPEAESNQLWETDLLRDDLCLGGTDEKWEKIHSLESKVNKNS